MESRKKFIKQVADTIIKNHNRYPKASFIFGISGKWGEGKTTFLDDLRDQLDDRGFKVVEINPWKFATDKTAFMRYFLTELSKEKTKAKKVLHWFTRKNRIKDLSFDSTTYKIHWLRLFLYTLAVVLLGVSYIFFIPELARKEVERYTVIIAALLTPVILSLISNLVKTQRGSKAISTTDEFDNLLNEILNDLSKKIVVYVDDLDRVTPEIARAVLDNLRTFFDRGRLSFIVTGDHTVLERYIGEQTLPRKDEPEQLEEGRRFLKKIFNVYWRLPLPIKKEFTAFLDGEYESRKDDLNKIFTSDESKQKLKSYLTKYFEMNFRQIIRFMDTVVFTFQIIEAQLESSTPETKKYFEDLKKKPLLVVRILMIQELCPPLFEKVLANPTALSDLEHFVENKETGAVAKIIKAIQNLSPTQETFIGKFLYEEPRFFKNKSWDVYSIEPFLHLAADSSFGDQRGPSSEAFTELARVGDPEQVKTSLANSGPKNLEHASDAAYQLIQNTTDITEKTNHLRTILTALKELPKNIDQSAFVNKLSSLDLSIYPLQDSSIRVPAYDLFWKWLDARKKEEVNETYLNKFPMHSNTDLNYISTEKGGHFTSHIVASWLWSYYAGGNADALEKMMNHFPHLDKEVVKEIITPHAETLISTLLTNAEINYREGRYFLIIDYVKDGSIKLKENVFSKMKHFDEGGWDWIAAKADEGDPKNKHLWTREQLKQEIHNALQDTTDLLGGLQFAQNKIPNDSEEIWDIIINRQVDNFIQAIPNMYGNGTYSTFVPPLKYAERLFKMMVAKIKEKTDEEKPQWIFYLKREMWMWLNLNLDNLPERKQIEAWSNFENEGVKQAAIQVLDSWIPPAKEE